MANEIWSDVSINERYKWGGADHLTILASCPSLIAKDSAGSKTVWLRECLAQSTQTKLMDTVMEYEITK